MPTCWSSALPLTRKLEKSVVSLDICLKVKNSALPVPQSSVLLNRDHCGSYSDTHSNDPLFLHATRTFQKINQIRRLLLSFSQVNIACKSLGLHHTHQSYSVRITTYKMCDPGQGVPTLHLLSPSLKQ